MHHWGPRTAFLKHLNRKSLYIPVYCYNKPFIPEMEKAFIWWWWGRRELNNFLKAACYLGLLLKDFYFLLKFVKMQPFPVFVYLHQQNWSAEIFQTLRASRVRSWQNFCYEITYSQCKIVWKRSRKLIIRPLKKHVTCIMAVFIILTCVLIPPISHFLSPPLCYPFKVTNYGMREKKIFIAASAYHVILKEIEHRIFRHNRIFRHTYMYKKPVWTN